MIKTNGLTANLQMLISRWHVIGILQKLGHISHDGLLIWVFHINILGERKYTERHVTVQHTVQSGILYAGALSIKPDKQECYILRTVIFLFFHLTISL